MSSMTQRMMLFSALLVMASGLFLTLTSVPASAHVRDRDKVRMCNGYTKGMRHFHGNTIVGYYFHTRFKFRSGHYVVYRTYKTGHFGTPYDRHTKSVNCRRY